jgi:membrane protease YdiL (CAAX protease family)
VSCYYQWMLIRVVKIKVAVIMHSPYLAPLSSMITLLILSTFVSEAYTPKLLTSTDETSLVITGISVGLVIGTLEEVGWSGYAVPRLLQSSYTVLNRSYYGSIMGPLALPTVLGS